MTRLDTAERRFWPKVLKTAGCWLWQAGIEPTGYGSFSYGTGQYAHRFAYELLVGPISEGLTLDHLCRVRRCVNPAHLEPVTRGENVRRGVGAALAHERYNMLWRDRTICVNGHVLAEVGIQMGRRGRYVTRVCKGCRREQAQRRYQRVATDPQQLATLRTQQREQAAIRRAKRSPDGPSVESS